jgi:hypothetical protein
MGFLFVVGRPAGCCDVAFLFAGALPRVCVCVLAAFFGRQAGCCDIVFLFVVGRPAGCCDIGVLFAGALPRV